MSGRYIPPVGGFLYFMRRGTAKQALLPKMKLLGGYTRNLFDVVLYSVTLASLIWALSVPYPTTPQLGLITLLIGVLGVVDKTIILCMRAEHYWITLIVLTLDSNWVAGAMVVQLSLWFWAGIAKLNAHFPAVVAVMTSNHPLVRSRRIRRAMYRDFPHDLRPSKLATITAHLGTLMELSIPILLLVGQGGTVTTIGLAFMVLFHVYITSNFPMAVPIEWNVVMVYSAFCLFGEYGHISVFSITSPSVLGLLALTAVIIPVLGHIYPKWFSFLWSMRYYAGNWAFSVWLFRPGSFARIADHFPMIAAHPQIQLSRLYDDETATSLMEKVIAFRAMHLHGRLLQPLLPLAVKHIDDYEYADGEIVAGLLLGWNFGDGHLHDESLIELVQSKCGFEPGDLRCIIVESQPLFRWTHDWRIVDASLGRIADGRTPVTDLLDRQPWPIDSRERFEAPPAPNKSMSE